MHRRLPILMMLSLLAACAAPVRTTTATTVLSNTPPTSGAPNPASQNCLALGGTTVIQSGPSGQTGFCALPGGAVVEEWALFRETHS